MASAEKTRLSSLENWTPYRLTVDHFRLSAAHFDHLERDLGHPLAKQKTSIEYSTWNFVSEILLDKADPHDQFTAQLSLIGRSTNKLVAVLRENRDSEQGSIKRSVHQFCAHACRQSEASVTIDSLVKTLEELAWVTEGFAALDFGPRKKGAKQNIDFTLGSHLKELTNIAFSAGSNLKLPSNQDVDDFRRDPELATPFLKFIRNAVDIALHYGNNAIQQSSYQFYQKHAAGATLQKYSDVHLRLLVNFLRKCRNEARTLNTMG